ncbi:MAG: glycosyltransferase [Fulvivirga sp.]|uniref:glycosyltransferase n=1 Tax=Fulvivirga sp. TaxID=1931237 RepID=UPI0032EB4782
MDLAPIVLFVYNRPWHTQKTLEALSRNELADKSDLFIFSDGPKNKASSEDLRNIDEVRRIITDISGFKSVNVTLREKNFGLANNVIEGVTHIINIYGKIVVLEDDLLTSRYFLQYCNEGLNLYKNETNVYSINAYQFPLETDDFDTFLSPLGTSSWGWATWSNKWKMFEVSPKYLNEIENNFLLQERFNFGGYNYSGILKNPNSWAIKWYYSVFLRNGLGLFPTQSLVENIGFDGSGQHKENSMSSKIHESEINLVKKDKIDLNYVCLVYDHLRMEKSGSPTREHYALTFIKSIANKIISLTR